MPTDPAHLPLQTARQLVARLTRTRCACNLLPLGQALALQLSVGPTLYSFLRLRRKVLQAAVQRLSSGKDAWAPSDHSPPQCMEAHLAKSGTASQPGVISSSSDSREGASNDKNMVGYISRLYRRTLTVHSVCRCAACFVGLSCCSTGPSCPHQSSKPRARDASSRAAAATALAALRASASTPATSSPPSSAGSRVQRTDGRAALAKGPWRRN